MNGLEITCDSCTRSWRLATAESVYVQLELASHPCPYCGAYTLSCRPAREAELPRLSRGKRLHDPLI